MSISPFAKHLPDIFLLVFSFGSGEKGQLGNGTTGERITTGNKTSYDIEVHPGGFFLLRYCSVFILSFSSLPQRDGR